MTKTKFCKYCGVGDLTWIKSIDNRWKLCSLITGELHNCVNQSSILNPYHVPTTLKYDNEQQHDNEESNMATNKESKVTPTTCFQWLCLAYQESKEKGSFTNSKLPIHIPAVNNMGTIAFKLGYIKVKPGNKRDRVWADLEILPSMKMADALCKTYHQSEKDRQQAKQDTKKVKVQLEETKEPDLETTESSSTICDAASKRHTAVLNELKEINSNIAKMVEMYEKWLD